VPFLAACEKVVQHAPWMLVRQSRPAEFTYTYVYTDRCSVALDAQPSRLATDNQWDIPTCRRKADLMCPTPILRTMFFLSMESTQTLLLSFSTRESLISSVMDECMDCPVDCPSLIRTLCLFHRDGAHGDDVAKSIAKLGNSHDICVVRGGFKAWEVGASA